MEIKNLTNLFLGNSNKELKKIIKEMWSIEGEKKEVVIKFTMFVPKPARSAYISTIGSMLKRFGVTEDYDVRDFEVREWKKEDELVLSEI